MGLKDRFNQASGAAPTPAASAYSQPTTQPSAPASSATATPTAAPAELTLAEMRAKLKAGQSGGVNPPEAAQADLSVAPKTGPNGESLNPDASAAVTATASISDAGPVSIAAPTVETKGKVSTKDVGAIALPDDYGKIESAKPFGSFLAVLADLQQALPPGVTLTITRAP
jgi:hypothetical protein